MTTQNIKGSFDKRNFGVNEDPEIRAARIAKYQQQLDDYAAKSKPWEQKTSPTPRVPSGPARNNPSEGLRQIRAQDSAQKAVDQLNRQGGRSPSRSREDLPPILEGSRQDRAQAAVRKSVDDFNNSGKAPTSEPKKTTSGGGFGRAFAAARMQGLKEFTWNGNRYNTKVK